MHTVPVSVEPARQSSYFPEIPAKPGSPQVVNRLLWGVALNLRCLDDMFRSRLSPLLVGPYSILISSSASHLGGFDR